MIDKIFETQSSFHVILRIKGKFKISTFNQCFCSIGKFFIFGKGLVLGYISMKM